MTTQTEIFDLGTTTHITSYWNNFFAFQSITPKVLRAINKQGFSTVKREKLVLYLLNSITFSKLYLSEVLYCPEAGYILVSIWQLDDTGFSTTFANGRYILQPWEVTQVVTSSKNLRMIWELRKEGNNTIGKA